MIKTNLYTICLSHVLLLKLFDVLFIWLSIYFHLLILRICSGIGCVALIRRLKFKSEWGFVRYCGPYGTYAMTMFLTNRELLLFCRLYPWPHIGSVCGSISSRWSIGRPWTLGAAVWRRSHGIYTAGAAGGLIIAWHVDAQALHAVFYLSMVDSCFNLMWSVSCNSYTMDAALQ